MTGGPFLLACPNARELAPVCPGTQYFSNIPAEIQRAHRGRGALRLGYSFRAKRVERGRLRFARARAYIRRHGPEILAAEAAGFKKKKKKKNFLSDQKAAVHQGPAGCARARGEAAAKTYPWFAPGGRFLITCSASSISKPD